MRGLRYMVEPSTPLTDEQAIGLQALPGLRYGPLRFEVPWHAWNIVQLALQQWGIRYRVWQKTHGKTVGTPLDGVAADGDLNPYALVPGLSPEAVEKATSYQRAGLAAFTQLRGGLAAWPCLAGDAELVANRAGRGFRIRLDELVRKLDGDVSYGGKRWDLSIPTCIRYVDDQGTAVSGEVSRAFASGVKEVFEVTVEREDGERRSLKATLDHLFRRSAPSGATWVQLRALELEDHVLVVGARTKKPRGKQREGTRRKYQVVAAIHHHPFASKWMRRKRSEANAYQESRVPLHRVVYEAHYLNGMTTEAYVAQLKTGNIEGLQFVDPMTHDVHHKNENPDDNDPSNLELLTIAEHQRHHSREGAWRNVLPRAVPARVISIEPKGAEPTYDVMMAQAPHSYVANDFVVHNCGSGKTLLGIAFSLAYPGTRALVITRSNTVGQWGDEFARWSEVEPYQITTAAHFSVRKTRQPKSETAVVLTTVGRLALRAARARLTAKPSRARVLHLLLLLLPDEDDAAPYPMLRLGTAERREVRKLIKKGLAIGTEYIPPRLPPFEVVDDDGTVVARHEERQAAEESRDQRNTTVDIPSGTRIAVIGWALLMKKLASLGRWNPDVVVVDECFAPGALIETEHGPVPIESIEPGTLVWSMDVEMGEQQLKPVLRRMAYERPRLGYHSARLVNVCTTRSNLPPCTPNHKVWTVESGYVEAGELQPGRHHLLARDRRLLTRDQRPARIYEIHATYADCPFVYDLEVADNHNYFAGGYLVSNSHRAKDHKRWVAHEDPDTDEIEFERLPTTSAAAQALCQRAAAVLLLTATPHPDRTRDWWGQLDLYDPFAWGTFHNFSLRHCSGHQGRYGWDSTGTSNAQELMGRVSHFLHHVTKAQSHAELPPLRRQVISLSLSELCSAGAALDDDELGSFGEGIRSQVAAMIALAAEQKREWLANRVVSHLGEQAKVVVLTVLRNSSKRLARTIRSRIKRVGGSVAKAAVWLGHGEVPLAERKTILAEYRVHTGPCVLVGTLAAWGEAWDGLQRTDRAIMGGLPWNHGMVIQLEGRFHRLRGGGYSPVIEYPIAAGTIEERIQMIVLDKLDAAVSILPDEGMEAVGFDLRQDGDEDALLDALAAALLAAEENP